ncbi:uncharacterized protein DFL_000833 [Arthrobotrys flagrans]|uniref:Tyrosine-protein kinase ephrin type A/B receptor-like domain-containing protein n=1 Tax=Arthrobotrys flagrans TaxID=97331 RepID=A0A437AEV6_ARTFL|nr:hypothetical protein DFL_000833 [Arthrobotrys flagrans]
MPSYTSLFICSVLALGASAQNDYGYVAAPPADSYGAASVSTSVTTAVTSTASSGASPEPPQATAAAAVCPITFEKGCAFLCGGPKFTPSCETEWFFSKESSCTPCPGIPDKCPSVPEPSCAFICKAQGAATSEGEAETPFCWASDITNKDEMACTPCDGAASSGFNATSVTPPSPPVYDATVSTHSHENGTVTVSTHHANDTSYAPPPIYTSGASAMTIGGSAIVGLVLAFFAL